MRVDPEAEASLAVIRERLGLEPDPTAQRRLESVRDDDQQQDEQADEGEAPK